VAVNCCVEPVVKRVGGFGAIAIEDNVGVVTAVEVEVNVVVVATGTVVEDLALPFILNNISYEVICSPMHFYK
jgi:hypothetical protein